MTAHPPTRAPVEAPQIIDPQPWRISREEYYRLAELGFFDGKRVERIHGEIRIMSPQGRKHWLAVNLVHEALHRAFPEGFFISVNGPCPTETSDPEPDLAVIPGHPRDYDDYATKLALVVEVSQTSLTFDMTIKARIYAAAGVADYWVIDLSNRVVHVFREPHADASSESGWVYAACTQHGPGDAIKALAARAPVAVDDLLP